MFYPDFFTVSYIGMVSMLISTVTAVHILLNKHEEPVSAVLWLLIVFIFPIFGVLFYLIFGINRVRTKGLRLKVANQLILQKLKKETEFSREISSIHKALGNHIDEQHEFAYIPKEEEYPSYCRMLDRLLPDSIPLKGNRVKLLLDGTQAYPRMLKSIREAK